MPQYRYKALTKGGQIIKNRLEDVSQQNVMNRLRQNGLTPISIEKIEIKLPQIFGERKKQRRNKAASITSTQNAIKKLQAKEANKAKGLKQDINFDLSFLDRVKPEDVIAFTQSLYLLKRANFTNVRAFTTLLENTKNRAMRDIIEDILNGVEARRFYIYNHGVLF